MNEKTVQYPVNVQFDLKFEAVHSAGYSWQPEPANSAKVKLIEKSFQPDKTKMKIGGVTTETWSFIGLEKGEFLLRFVYKRSWESTAQKTEEVKVQIF